MSEDDRWAVAHTAWVPLTDLVPAASREFGIPETEIRKALRQPLETCVIDATFLLIQWI